MYFSLYSASILLFIYIKFLSANKFFIKLNLKYFEILKGILILDFKYCLYCTVLEYCTANKFTVFNITVVYLKKFRVLLLKLQD